MDVISNVLRTFKLTAHVFLHSNFQGSWAVDTSGTMKATFHLVSRGAAWLHLPDQDHPVPLRSGDLVVFPHDAPHTISNATTAPEEDTVFNQPGGSSNEGPSTGLICGYFEFERHNWNPLLNALPDAIVIKGEEAAHTALMHTIMQSIMTEIEFQHAGSDVVIDKLSEVLFIHVIRNHMQRSDSSSGYLAALADKQIGLALSSIHEQPGEAWSVESLAYKAGMSRSVFSNKFHQLVRMTPMQYVTCWRMQRAHERFTTTQESVAHVAELFGYQSEASFSKAFKKHFNYGPGAARRSSR
jgi:AraC family transcriptional regulator, activator of mtrCDE